MAITLYSQPELLSTSKAPIIFEVTSDATDITKKIVAVLYYRTSQAEFWREAVSKEASRYPNKSFFRFNFDQSIDKLLTADYFDAEAFATPAIKTSFPNTTLEYYVVFTEYYPDTAFAAHGTLTTGSYYATQINLLKTETQSVYTSSEWFLVNGQQYKFLTNSPLVQSIRAGETFQLGFNTNNTAPKVQLSKTLKDNSVVTSAYTQTKQYTHYLWDYTVDASEVVTIPSTYIEALTGGLTSYEADTDGNMYGAIKLAAFNDVCDIVLPVVLIASGSVAFSMRIKSLLGSNDYLVYYYDGATWNAAGLGVQAATTSYATYSETLPSGTTKVRIKNVDPTSTRTLVVAWGKITYSATVPINYRCKFAIDSTYIDSDTKSVDVWVSDSSNNPISETRTFIVDNEPMELSARLEWKNMRGDFDAFTFKYGYSENLSVEKIKFIKELPISFTSYDRQVGVSYVSSEIVFTSYTDIDQNLEWLGELLESDMVFVIIDNVRIPIDILSESTEIVNYENPLTFGVNWKFANKRYG